MKKQKILLILLLALTLFTTACGKTNESKKETTNKQEVKKEKEKEEEKINVAGTYFVYNDETKSTYNDEYITLNEDMSFDRQVNYCAGRQHLEGTYEVKKDGDKILIEFKVNDHENIPIQVEYKNDQIIADHDKYVNPEGTYNEILNLVFSCNSINDKLLFNKGDSSQIDYKESIYADAYIGPN